MPSVAEQIAADMDAAYRGLSLGGNHQYRLDGKWIPGVTTILRKLDKSDALLHWAAKLAETTGNPWAFKERRQTAADVGTQAHALIEHECRIRMGILDSDLGMEITDEARFIFSGWQEWADKVKFEPILLERAVCSRKHWFAGKLDVLAFVNGRLTLCDWKTGRQGRLYQEHKLQIHGYRACLREAGIDPEGLVVVLPKEGPDFTIRPYPIPWDEEAFAAFLGLKAAYHWTLRDARESA